MKWLRLRNDRVDVQDFGKITDRFRGNQWNIAQVNREKHIGACSSMKYIVLKIIIPYTPSISK
jgi:hypothetical protein